MKEPLNQFADRILRNNELPEFIAGLVKEKGVKLSQLSVIVRDLLRDGEYLSGCCLSVPMGGTTIDPMMSRFTGRPPERTGRCAACGQIATFTRNPNYVEKET